MSSKCDCCGGDSVADIRNPALGDYSACNECMMRGMRPPCADRCGRQSEFIADGRRWCSQCYESDRIKKEALFAVQRAEKMRAAEAEFERRIELAVARAFRARGW